MTVWPNPPRFARRLLERALPADVREAVCGDLNEMFERDCRADGPLRARWRYWGNALSFSRHFIVERWHDRRRGGKMGIGMSWLDVKLSLRMLVRYPGLSIVGGLGIAMVIVCGTVAGIFDAVVHGSLPFENGDRVVAIENWDTSRNEPQSVGLHDFESWRHDLGSVHDVGAYRFVRRNVASVGLAAEPVRIAEISAVAFAIAHVPPVLGRYLTVEDERERAPAVIVIGHGEWQRRFAGDPHVLGRTLQVGDTESTVVGVMPAGFGFPVNEHYWIPLRLKRADFERPQAPSSMPYKQMPHGVIHVFGRLADGVDLAAAQAELAVIGERAAAEFPNTHARLRPRVLRYTDWFFDEQHDGETLLLQSLVALLLGVVGANVAVLVYARTAARQMEIALRSALGASRRRIVTQMFVEGLALSGAAAAVGLLAAAVARRQLDGIIDWEQAPFWVDTSVTSGTVVSYVLALAMLGALIVGVIPALQATSRRAQTGLQHAASSSSGWRIGWSYAVLIVVQVALAVAILPYAVSSTWTSIREAVANPGFPANEFLTARLDMEPAGVGAESTAADSEFSARFRDRQAELARRLDSTSGVSNVTFLTGVPGSEPKAWIDVEDDGFREVGIDRIGVEFFEVFNVPILAGRPFDLRDVDPSSRSVVVNRTFAQSVIGGNALGHRVRLAGSQKSAPAPWFEIVGVVENFPMPGESTLAEPRMYHPVARGDARLALLALRVRGAEPTAFATQLRQITTTLDRRLLLRDIRPMDALLREQQMGSRLGAWVSGLATMSLLLLSATGLYALMAFTVTQRRREIGIRVALGVNPRRLLSSVFSRALWQLAAGIVIGVSIAALMDVETGGELTGGTGLRMLPAVAAFVLLIGLTAAAGPARRGLRIQPNEALKEG